MPTYYVEFPEHPGRRFKVESDQPLSESAAYQYAKPQADALRAEQVQAEQSTKPFRIGDIGAAAGEVAQGQTGMQRLMGGFGTGLQSVAQGIDELLPGRPLNRAAAAISGSQIAPDMREANKGYVSGGGWQAQTGDILGKIAPTLAVPANAVGGLGIASRMPRLAHVLGTMLTAGGVAGATTPGGAGERAKSAGFAAGMAGILPGATAAMQAVRRGTTRAGRELGRAEAIRDLIGRADEDQVLAALRGPYEGSRLGVQPTAGMLTRNPAVQRLEQGARVRDGGLFAERDIANAAARWAAVNKVAGDESQLAALEAFREAATKGPRTAALFMAKLDPGVAGRVSQAADAMLAGPSGINPAVKTMGQMVKSAVDDPSITPERLYELRKVLTGGYTPGTELGAAIKSAARERSILIGAIDDALDKASNGVWGKYMDAYKKASAPITSMKAGQKIRERFTAVPDEIPAQMGERPAPELFGRTVKKEGSKLFGSTWKDRLSPEDRELLDTITRDLARQAEVMRPRGTIGSPTAPFMEASKTAENIGATLIDQGLRQAVPMGGGLVSGAIAGARQGMENARNRALAEVLQNPEKLSDLILKARQAERILGATGEVSRAARAIGDPWE